MKNLRPHFRLPWMNQQPVRPRDFGGPEFIQSTLENTGDPSI
jgi:hypothetical protein